MDVYSGAFNSTEIMVNSLLNCFSLTIKQAEDYFPTDIVRTINSPEQKHISPLSLWTRSNITWLYHRVGTLGLPINVLLLFRFYPVV